MPVCWHTTSAVAVDRSGWQPHDFSPGGGTTSLDASGQTQGIQTVRERGVS